MLGGYITGILALETRGGGGGADIFFPRPLTRDYIAEM